MMSRLNALYDQSLLLIVFLTCSVAANIQTMLEETQVKFEERYSVFHFHTIFSINLLRATEASYLYYIKELNKNIHL